MAIYSYEAPDGRIIDLEGDSPATEQELEQVFSSLPPPSIAQQQMAMGLLGGTGIPITDPIERERLGRQRTLQRAAMEGEAGSFRLRNAGTPQETLESVISNQRFQAPSHLSRFVEDFSRLIPFRGAGAEFEAGANSGRQLVGDNLTGSAIGNLILGPARSANTVFNPIGGLISEVPVVAQGVGAGIGGGDLESALRALNERRPIESFVEIPQADDAGNSALNTLLNTGVNIGNEVINQPLLLAGATPGALRTQGTALRNLPSNVAALATDTAALARGAGSRVAAPFRSSTPVDPVAVESALKRVQDLEFQREQNRINTNKTAEARNAQDLILQEELAIAQQEAATLGEQALQANIELGPQIEGLLQASQEAAATAQGIRGRLPAAQEPSQFGTSVAQAIDEATGRARTQAAEDYSAVKESLPESQPKLPATNVEIAAENISNRKAQGYSAALERTLKSVLGESSRIRRADPLSGLSDATRDIYNRLPESQKQSFLDQAGINLSETQGRTYTWDQLQQRYQDLNRFIEEARARGNNQDVAAYQQLKNATAADMNAYAQAVSPETKALFDDANARFAANQDILGTGTIGRLTSDLALETPESILGKMVGNEKASVINNIKKVVSPEKFQEVQAQYADRLMSPSKDVAFDPNHFIKQFEAINNETLKSVFGEEGFAELRKIDQLSKDSIKVEELQKTLDNYNSKAQTAQDAYQRARTAADQKRILDSSRNEAEAALEAIKDEKFNRDIEKARADLKKAQTPERVSFIVRALYGLISFGGFALSGAPVAGVAAGLAAAALGRVINTGRRSAASQISKVLEKK